MFWHTALTYRFGSPLSIISALIAIWFTPQYFPLNFLITSGVKHCANLGSSYGRWNEHIDSTEFTVHSIVQYSTVQYSTVQYSTVQYSTVQYSTVQYSTVQYTTLHYTTS